MENNIVLRESITWSSDIEIPESLKHLIFINKCIEYTTDVKRIIKRQRRSLFGIRLKKGIV